MHLAWRWFTGLGLDQKIPYHSTFSKNRHRRFQESKLSDQLFEEIVRHCVEAGPVQGEHLSVDWQFRGGTRIRPPRFAGGTGSYLLCTSE